MESGSHTKKKTAGDGDTNDQDDPSGEVSGYSDDDRRPDRRKRPDNERDAEDTHRLVREISSSMEACEKVTGQTQKQTAIK